MTVPELLRQRPECQPLIAKIDIEGAEEELFSADTSWVERFPVLIVEIHDWLYPGQATSRPLIKVLAGLDRDLVIAGENLVSIARGATRES